MSIINSSISIMDVKEEWNTRRDVTSGIIFKTNFIFNLCPIHQITFLLYHTFCYKTFLLATTYKFWGKKSILQL